MNGILDGKFIAKGTISEEKLSEEVISKLENTGNVGVENLIAKKWVLDWRNYTDTPHNMCYPTRDEDGEYLRINPATVRNYISKAEHNDVFFGKIKFKENTRYTLKIKMKRLTDSESGSGAFYIYAKYTNGTTEKFLTPTPTMQNSPIGEIKEFTGTSLEGKTISHIYISYGSGHTLGLYEIMLTEGTQAPEGYIPHKEDLPYILHKEDSLLGKATGVCTKEGAYYNPNPNGELLSSAKTMEVLVTIPEEVPVHENALNHYIFRLAPDKDTIPNVNLAMTLYVRPNGTASLYSYTRISATHVYKNVELGKTYHLLATLNEEDKELNVYLDGEFIGKIAYEGSVDSPISLSLGSPTETGAISSGYRNFTGTIHQARLFNKTFTQEDVNALWNNGSPWAYRLTEEDKLENGLQCIAEYLPSGFTKTHAIDTSGNGLDMVCTTVAFNPIPTYQQWTEDIEIVQETGDSEEAVMSQKGVTDALNKKANAAELKNYLPLNGGNLTGTVNYNGNEIATVNNIPSIVKATGNSDTVVMSQKTVTEELSKKIDISELNTIQEDTTGGTKVLEVESAVISVLATSQTNYRGFSTDRKIIKVINNSELQVILTLEMESAGNNRILKDFDISAIILPKACSIELFNTGKGWRIINTFGFTLLPDFANSNRQGDYALKVSNDGSVSAEEIADFVTVDESVTIDLSSEQLDELFPDAVSGFQYICPSNNCIYTKVSALGGWVKYTTTRV